MGSKTTKTKRHRYENVVLGFTESATEETNLPEQFASKAGGKPVWLYRGPKYIPNKVPKCKICGQREMFLCQIYAPIEEETIGHNQAFHRVLYITLCTNTGCMNNKDGSKGVSVFRGQLKRDNPFYPYSADEDIDDDDEDGENQEQSIENVRDSCNLCAFWGELLCSNCKAVRYCSKKCQKEDWFLGNHRNLCIGNSNSSSSSPSSSKVRNGSHDFNSIESKWRVTELEIFTDRHCTPPVSDTEDSENEDEDEGEDEGQVDNKEIDIDREIEKAGATMQDISIDELPEDLFENRNKNKDINENDKEDKRIENKFKRIISYEVDQVVRYERNGEIIWASNKQQCKNENIKNCELCGCKRIFEMQIMYQLVYMIEKEYNINNGNTIVQNNNNENRMQHIARRLRDDMNWVTIIIFTCENSCSLSIGQYTPEMAWIQRL